MVMKCVLCCVSCLFNGLLCRCVLMMVICMIFGVVVCVDMVVVGG